MNIQTYNKFKQDVLTHYELTQEINAKQEELLTQELGYSFAETPNIDFEVWGWNKHIVINDNMEIVINVNGHISITDEGNTVWYQVITGSEVNLPYSKVVIDFNYSGFDIDGIINSFTSEVELHRFMELLKVDVANLKQRLWELNNSNLKLELIEDEKLMQELTSLREVS